MGPGPSEGGGRRLGRVVESDLTQSPSVTHHLLLTVLGGPFNLRQFGLHSCLAIGFSWSDFSVQLWSNVPVSSSLTPVFIRLPPDPRGGQYPRVDTGHQCRPILSRDPTRTTRICCSQDVSIFTTFTICEEGIPLLFIQDLYVYKIRKLKIFVQQGRSRYSVFNDYHCNIICVRRTCLYKYFIHLLRFSV